MFLLALAACASPDPDILLVTLDTTRADALGVYGQAPSPSPNLDTFATDARVFEEALTVTPLTLPAHATILTGQPPGAHGLRRNGVERLPDSVATAAEHLRAAGWQTGAFVSAVVLARGFGLERGFDTYEGEFAAVDGPAVPSRPAEDATDACVRWLLSLDVEAPFFAWVHYYDPHLPNTRSHPTFQDPYLAEIAHMDERFGQLLAAVAAARRRPLAVVVLADHGEGRGAHGEETHGWFVYRTTMRVPLLLRGPGVEPGRVDLPVSALDVAPTLLAFAGIDAALPGRDLRGSFPPAVVTGETFTPRDALGFADLHFAQDEQHRFILAPRPELYDWRADPGETRDLGPVHPAASTLASALSQPLPSAPPTSAAATDEARVAALLAALGYTDAPGAVPAGTASGDLPDPKDDPGALATVEAALRAAHTVSPAAGIAPLEAALARYPRAAALRASLSRAYELVGRLDDAYAVVAPPDLADDPAVRGRRARIRLAQGRWDDALALAEGTAEAPFVRAEIARLHGDPEAAVAIAREALRADPSSGPLALVAGAALLDGGFPDAALPWLARARERMPSEPSPPIHLARAMLARDDLAGARATLLTQRAQFGEAAATGVLLGKIEAARGDLEAARVLLTPLAEAPELDWEAALVCAEAHQRAGDTTQAAAWRARARRLGWRDEAPEPRSRTLLPPPSEAPAP
jgi:arylsulfatase A-like enzyme/tetratricopeptide (TPR) repeat protein